MSKKTLFDTLYAAKEEIVQGMQKPGREKMIRRVADRLADEVSDKRNESELRIADLEHHLANTKNEDEALGIYKQIVKLRREADEAEELAKAVTVERDKLFGPASETAEEAS